MDLISFIFQINKSQYIKRNTGSLFPPDKGQEMSGSKLFLGGWFVSLEHGRVAWVGKVWTIIV